MLGISSSHVNVETRSSARQLSDFGFCSSLLLTDTMELMSAVHIADDRSADCHD